MWTLCVELTVLLGRRMNCEGTIIVPNDLVVGPAGDVVRSLSLDSSSGVATLLVGDPESGTNSSMNRARSARREVGLVSDYDKTAFFHFLIAQKSARAKLRPPTVESAQRLGLIGVEDEDDGIRSTENAEERKDQRRSCPAVSYARRALDKQVTVRTWRIVFPTPKFPMIATLTVRMDKRDEQSDGTRQGKPTLQNPRYSQKATFSVRE
ncbi:hypothetical protein BGY98DRAFT_1181623 [Russula aff. rugulosa BPL654]|nr:hypothetical protein BGY98DRAFT_1181623 [Russula aff. rugulosa BPL654]